jgi:hypothetical protein
MPPMPPSPHPKNPPIFYYDSYFTLFYIQFLNSIHVCLFLNFFRFNVYTLRMIKSRRKRWAGHVARMGAPINAYRILVGNPEGKRPLGRLRHRWVDNIKIDLR